MFNVKRLNQLENVLLESNLIKVGQQFVAINNDYQKASNEEAKQDSYKRLDYLIDLMIDQRIIDLESDLQQPIGEREFGSEFGATLVKGYLQYCRGRIADLSELINEELRKKVKENEKLRGLAADRIRVAARIEALEKIYKAFKLTRDQEMNRRADDILNSIDSIKNEMAKDYEDSIRQIGTLIQEPLISIRSKNSNTESKKEDAYNIYSQVNSLNVILPFYPQDAQEGAKKATNHINQTIENEIGKEEFENVKRSILSNDREMAILKRILNLKYMHFTSEDEIHREIDRIKISINGLEGTHNGVPLSSPQVIEYLRNLLSEEADRLLQRAREKNITLKGSKGIRYNFNARLKLYEEVQLPVTGKQIADSTWIMKFRKRMHAIIQLLPAGEGATTAAGQAWANFGRQTHDAYAKVLNKAGKVIGKMIGGREGELKGDAITRLLIPATDVLNKDRQSSPVNEEGMPGTGATSPGTAYQVPGSIGTQGPIVPPTENTIGSGDKFQPGVPKKKTKKKKKKKKTRVYEEELTIMNFSDFVK